MRLRVRKTQGPILCPWIGWNTWKSRTMGTSTEMPKQVSSITYYVQALESILDFPGKFRCWAAPARGNVTGQVFSSLLYSTYRCPASSLCPAEFFLFWGCLLGDSQKASSHPQIKAGALCQCCANQAIRAMRMRARAWKLCPQ